MTDDPAVMKFGGACFKSTEDYLQAARIIVDTLRSTNRVVVVVSAMFNATSALQNALDALNRNVSQQISAQLLTTGDLQSAAFLAAAVSAHGVSAQLLGSHRTGLVGSGSPLRAQLRAWDADYLRSIVHRHHVVVLPGGQASGEGGSVVMLGRNSSDLSAVSVAAAVGSTSCRIVSEVPGVYTADPAIVPDALLIDELDYQTVLEVGRSGARVLHPQAIRMAQLHRVEIRCTGSPPELRTGTVITAKREHRHTIVIAAPQSEVWRVSTMNTLRRLESDLAGDAIETVLVPRSGQTFIVVPSGFYRAATENICSGRAERTNLRLLSLIRPGKEPERILVDAERLVSETRHHHARAMQLASTDRAS